nr:hypothetical protein [Tanacetum cinerariifolium]
MGKILRPEGRLTAGNWHPNDIKVDIPEYDGKLDPDEFVEWLRTVEWVFDYKQTTEDNKVKIVALKLRKYASTWWSNTCLKRERNSNAEEYSREFEYLLMTCDVPEDDPQTLVRYMGGLEPRVANVVELHSYQTLAELTILSHKVDSQQRSKGKYESNRQSIKPTSYSKPNLAQKNTAPSLNQQPTFPSSKSEPLRAPRQSPPGDNVEVTEPDEGPCLVVRWTLNTTPIQETKLQRESIFHTRCTVAQKVCSVIIDGGSCTNVASQTLVTKLNLPTQAHPTPYVIQWLNQGKGIRVSHRVLLSFSIGKSYTDELWCDVILMDACHVLLGRPWQFDRGSFKEFILLGLDEEDTPSQPILSLLVQALLKSYSQVFPAEIPHGLPPKRSIQHKIDLIPGSTLPNKPAYRTNPQETIKIRKQ